MASSQRRNETFLGYRSWFDAFRFNERISLPIFILDYQTSSFWKENEETINEYETDQNHSRSMLINGIQIFFLDENHQKRKAFLRHEPYFYLLLEKDLSKEHLNRIISQIYQIGENHVQQIEEKNYYDAADLTFLVSKSFLKITVDHPGSVPKLRDKCEALNGVIEWREADVLFHHRTAIDHNLRVGYWYQAEIRGGEIQSIYHINNKAPPQLKILAFDIETAFETTREPNPNRDEISMISLFTGDRNYLLVNSSVVETKDIRNIDILLRYADNEHKKPWVDWRYSNDTFEAPEHIEKYYFNIQLFDNEREILQAFYQVIRDYQPDVLADFFGGRFDIPFLSVRSELNNLSLERETGFKIVFKIGTGKRSNEKTDLKNNYTPNSIDYVEGAGIIHLDAFLFNEKYSYLPKKDLGLKQSVEKKLKIIPIGREALFAIEENPAEAAAYAGCDGYISWKYVKEIVLDFFISMGQMFPVPASELLSRRSGSLDDLLIDAENFQHGIVSKRKISSKIIESFSPKLVINNLAYTGGLVEARRPGIFRSDIFYDFKSEKEALDELKIAIEKVIRKESMELNKKIIKEEFEKQVLSELGDVVIEYSEDPSEILSQIESGMVRNGVPRAKLKIQLNKIRDILENISAYHPEDVENIIDEVFQALDKLKLSNDKTKLIGVHVDVTSMYPSQIRQYKLQPSGIVPLTKCQTCDLYEKDESCLFDGDWVIKISSQRPCRFKVEGSSKCDPSVCKAENELKCKRYQPLQDSLGRSQEIYTFNGEKTEAYTRRGDQLIQVPISETYLGLTTEHDLFISVQQWLRRNVEATQLTTKLDKNYFDIFEDQPPDFELPPNTFMSIDTRTKKISILLSVNSRVCQKAYNFVARIMDDFFNTRVKHKLEAQRLKQVISQRKSANLAIPSELTRLQKFHDSTQLGMKVPLNSIYGLLGMKGGVRNASTPCAGITTKLSADLIHWAAEELEYVGLVTELDTDGIWLWVPQDFPLFFKVCLSNPNVKNSKKQFEVSLIDKILNEKVKKFSQNDNYWVNDGHCISRSRKNLIKFEQDGPYDFQFVMGKKKYIIYNYENNEWQEKEITGLESKRADFSKLQKYFQEKIINSYLEDYDPQNPITLEELYQNADKMAQKIKEEIYSGTIDPSYFVKPKAINKPLSAYKSKLPQVNAAYILRDLGFSVDPGTRIQMLNLKGNHVIPRQVFDFDFKKIKEVLVKHAIATLSFMLGELSTKEDLMKLIDVNQYSEDLFGPGRIYDRMIKYPMEIQQVSSSAQTTLNLKSKIRSKKTETDSNFEDEGPITEEKENLKNEKALPHLKPKPRQKRGIRRKKKRQRNEAQPIALDALLEPSQSVNKGNKIEIKENEYITRETEAKKVIQIRGSSDKVESEVFRENSQNKSLSKDALVSTDEISELESDEIFNNGSGNGKSAKSLELGTLEEELIVCSECGALVSPREITNEGCIFCGGESLI